MSHTDKAVSYDKFVVSMDKLAEMLKLSPYILTKRAAATAVLQNAVTNGACNIDRETASMVANVPTVVALNNALGYNKVMNAQLLVALAKLMRNRDYISLLHVSSQCNRNLTNLVQLLKASTALVPKATFDSLVESGKILTTRLPFTGNIDYFIPRALAEDVLQPLGTLAHQVIETYFSTHPVQINPSEVLGGYYVKFATLCNALDVKPSDYATDLWDNGCFKAVDPSVRFETVLNMDSPIDTYRTINRSMGSDAYSTRVFDRALHLAALHPQFISVSHIAASTNSSVDSVMGYISLAEADTLLEAGKAVGACFTVGGVPYLTYDLSLAVADKLGEPYKSVVSGYWTAADKRFNTTFRTLSDVTPNVVCTEENPRSKRLHLTEKLAAEENAAVQAIKKEREECQRLAELEQQKAAKAKSTAQSYLDKSDKHTAEAERLLQKADSLYREADERTKAACAKLGLYADPAFRMTVKQYVELCGLLLSDGKASAVGKKATALLREADIAATKVPDEQYGSVNAYPVHILTAAFRELGYCD